MRARISSREGLDKDFSPLKLEADSKHLSEDETAQKRLQFQPEGVSLVRFLVQATTVVRMFSESVNDNTQIGGLRKNS